MHKKLFALFLISLSLAAFAEKKVVDYGDYKLTAFYKSSLEPGDAVFVRLVFETDNKKLIKKLPTDLNEEGSLEVSYGNKIISKSHFYSIEKSLSKKLVKSVLLSACPLSTFAKTGEWTASVTFSAFGKEENRLELPFSLVSKDFVSETIPLNASNTKIRSNVSSERMKQIEKLNAILGAKNNESVYETSSFVAPTPATRRTSFFGDRRVFAYSNGKSSTSLHYGIDYGIPTGSEVRSCGKGVVVLAEDRITTGWSLCIEHLPGLYSLYYHMSRLDVNVGDYVEPGSLLGLSGATGLATGPHLHWEVRLNMEAVSPDFMTGDFAFEKESRD